MGPLIPYLDVPELPLPFIGTILEKLGQHVDPRHPPSIKPFGTLVAFGVYLGSVIALRHAKQRGIDPKKMSDFIFWTIGLGFVGGHVFDAIFYHPGHLVSDPLYIVKLWDGLSSYGGFLGAVIGAFAWKASRKESMLSMVEIINSAFPLAWVFGRMGCASVHDHPGHVSDAWFAVRACGPFEQPQGVFTCWPYPQGGSTGRFDLGLYEMVLSIPLAIAFLWLWHKKPIRPNGFYTGWMCVAYAPVRFCLDFLRERENDLAAGDPRYGGLTPAQWACFGLLAMGIFFLRVAKRGEATLGQPVPATGTAEDGATAEDEDDGEVERVPTHTERSEDADEAEDAEVAKPKGKKPTRRG